MTYVLQVEYPNAPPLPAKSNGMEEHSSAPRQMMIVQAQSGGYGGRISSMTSLKSLSSDIPTSRPVPTPR